jgi:hypothetical protein
VKDARVPVVIEVDPVLIKVHFHPVVCCSLGNQIAMIVKGGYGDDSPSRLLFTNRPPTKLTQVVHDLDGLERAALHLGKSRLSDVDSH